MLKKMIIAMVVKEVMKFIDTLTKPEVDPTARRSRDRGFTEPSRGPRWTDPRYSSRDDYRRARPGSSSDRFGDYDGYHRDHLDPL